MLISWGKFRPRQKYSHMERVKGIEPSFPPWKGGVLATVRHPRVPLILKKRCRGDWTRTSDLALPKRALLPSELLPVGLLTSAEGGTRTHTVLPPRDFKSRASASSATSADRNCIILRTIDVKKVLSGGSSWRHL